MAVSRYTSDIDLTNLNDSHTLGILAVPPRSRVLDVGAADGSVARVLQKRGCTVWGIELDEAAAAEARRYCEAVITGDAETLDLAGLFPEVTFDAILLLDVLEHLREPERLLGSLAPLLSPGGLVVASIPNVTHADVCLQLLSGRFTYTATGLLDHTHLRFFDRASVEALFANAGFRIIDNLRVRYRLGETEIGINAEEYPPEVVAAATTGPDAETYQFVIVASLRSNQQDYAAAPPLVAQLLERVGVLETELREGRAHIQSVSAELQAGAEYTRQLERIIAERDECLATLRHEQQNEHNTYESRITALHELVNHQNDLISGLNQLNAQREGHIRRLAEDLTRSGTQLSELNQHLIERERLLTELDKRLREVAGVSSGRLIVRRIKYEIATALRTIPPVYYTTRMIYRQLRKPR
jgi:2-polyprenyl-3-methyl-5-hydroxy-6-metoxy-1,4-benzoquinol methylase/uncharacterized coiled-coil protein SlyX